MTTRHWGRALTRTDLASMPDDGHRYELIDETLLGSPAPAVRHQVAVTRLLRLLDDAKPADSLALPAPLDVVLEVGHVVGDEPFETTEPVTVTVVPSTLVRGA